LGRHTPPSRLALLWKRRVCGGARRFLCSLHSLGHVNEVVRVARFRQRVRVGGIIGAVVSTFGAVLSAVSSRRCLPYPLKPDGERRDERRDETHSRAIRSHQRDERRNETHSQAIRAHQLPLSAHLLASGASSWAPAGSHGRSLRLALSHACLLTKQIWQISMQRGERTQHAMRGAHSACNEGRANQHAS
jgi:hypothetical protein